MFSHILGPQNVQKSTSKSGLGVISIPNWIKQSRPTHWKAQNDPKTSKLDRNRPENFPRSAAAAEPWGAPTPRPAPLLLSNMSLQSSQEEHVLQSRDMSWDHKTCLVMIPRRAPSFTIGVQILNFPILFLPNIFQFRPSRTI